MEIKIDRELSSLIPKLSEEEHRQLKENILRDGCREPLSLWRGSLLDGHNRYEICQKHNISFETKEINLASRDEARIWLINNQLGRRNLTPFQRIELVVHLESIYAKQGKENMSEARRQKGLPNSAKLISTREEISKLAKVGHNTYDRAKLIIEKATEEQKEALRNGKTTINRVYSGIRREEAFQDAAKMREKVPDTKYKPLIKQISFEKYLSSVEDESVDLLLTDPPYSTEVKDIYKFAEWVKMVLPKIKPTGRAYIFAGAYPEELEAYLRILNHQDKMILRNVLVWTYRNTLGAASKMGYKQNWQAILYLHGKKAGNLICPLLKEQFAVQDINAPDARKGRIRYHGFEKPAELAERLISHSTKEGDLVFDCFAGTGTFILAAVKLGRRAIGCEIADDMLKIAQKRGCIIE